MSDALPLAVQVLALPIRTLFLAMMLCAALVAGAAEPPAPFSSAELKAQEQRRSTVAPLLDTPVDGQFRLAGCVQNYAEAISRNWLRVMAQNNPDLFERFRTAAREPYGERVPWDGEFPGKHLTGAVEIYRLTRDPELFRSIETFVGELVPLQRPNGYLGVWAPQYELTGKGHPSVCGEITWDMWNHNHILLGLISWYEESGDPRALECAGRIADRFCEKFLGHPGTWGSCPEPYTNLSTSHALALLYRLTGKREYLDLAQQVLTAETAACGLDFVARAKQGEEYAHKASGARGTRWETLHLMLAYSEMYLLTGNPDYRQVIEHYWRSLTRTDCHNNGGFSSLESACGNPFDTRSIETCCTVAYMALGVEALRLSGDSRVADQLEISTLNAALSFFARNGRWSTYNTVMEGRIVPCAPERPGCHENPGIYCCTVNAPRGIGLLSRWALMTDADGLAVNWYGPGTMSATVAGKRVRLTQSANYPRESTVHFTVDPGETRQFSLKFRIPFWSSATTLKVNGQTVPALAGSYATVQRNWAKGDQVEIAFQMSPRYGLGAKEYAGRTCLYRGPVLLAQAIPSPRENGTFEGTWSDTIRVRETQYYSLVGSETKGDRAQFKFQGDAVVWRYQKANNAGIARVYVDGKLLDTVDLFAENDMRDFFAYDRGLKGMFLSDRWERSGFGPGEHVLVLEVSGEKNEISQGTWVQIRDVLDRRSDPVLDAQTLAWELLPASDPAGLDVRLRVTGDDGQSWVLKDYDSASKDERVFLTWLRIEHVPTAAEESPK